MKEQNFGRKLIEIRKAKGLTQEEVAEKCKITVRTIQRIESGSVTPRAFTIKVISEVLGFNFFETSNTGDDVGKKQRISNLKENIVWNIKDLFNLKTNTMKKVSILSLSCLIIGFSLFFLTSETNAKSLVDNNSKLSNYINTKDRIQVAFTNEFTLDSLVFIKNDLETRGITINYKKIEFDDNKRLQSIECEVDCNDGYKGSFSINYLNTQNKERRTGFYRDYSKNAKSTFGTGSID